MKSCAACMFAVVGAQDHKLCTSACMAHALGQDLCLDLSKQLCILSFCRGLPRVWGQRSGKIPATMGSSGCSPPAYLTSSNGWALHQEHIPGGPGG
eukprot:1138678-Pelagomonas_calceolata.AAC.17